MPTGSSTASFAGSPRPVMTAKEFAALREPRGAAHGYARGDSRGRERRRPACATWTSWGSTSRCSTRRSSSSRCRTERDRDRALQGRITAGLADIWSQSNNRLRWACVLPSVSAEAVARAQLDFARKQRRLRGVHAQHRERAPAPRSVLRPDLRARAWTSTWPSACTSRTARPADRPAGAAQRRRRVLEVPARVGGRLPLGRHERAAWTASRRCAWGSWKPRRSGCRTS